MEIVVGDTAQLEDALAADVERAGRLALDARGIFTIALPGGSIALGFFPRLSRVPLDWSRTAFFWVDERAVPPTDPDSNYAAAWQLWLKPAAVPPERIHRMRGEDSDLRRAATAYAEELAGIAGTPPQLDLVLLGVGADGHIASLFPGRPMAPADCFVEVVELSPKPPPRRLTLTLATLLGARQVEIVALGGSKAEAIRGALDPASDGPLARLVLGARRVRLLLDREAASLLPRGRLEG